LLSGIIKHLAVTLYERNLVLAHLL